MVAVSSFLIVFRIVHILGGVLWVGSAFLVAVFIEPTVAAIGPAAGPFMSHMIEKLKISIVITALGGLTVLGGLILYWHDFHVYYDGTLGSFVSHRIGFVFTVGAVSAIIALFGGVLGIKPAAERLGALSKEIGAGGGPPTPEQQGEMKQLMERMRFFGRFDLVFLIIAVLAMSTARYW
jgi:hypothetical protein